MDLRERAFWRRQAERNKLSGQIRAVNAAVMANADSKGYRSVVNDLQRTINDMDTGKTREDRVAENWAALRNKKG